MKTPKKVKIALEHVRKFYPDVVQVFYGIDGRWLFMDADMQAPSFNKYLGIRGKIDVGILEDAADSVENVPAAFAIDFE